MKDIIIFGVGGAGCYLAEQFQTALEFPSVAINTDKASLKKSTLTQQLLIGPETFRGKGSILPVRGRAAAEESKREIQLLLDSTRILILTAGMGGVTGTGATPVIANFAKDRGIDVIAAVTLPFEFESAATQKNASEGIRELEKTGATLLIHNHSTDTKNINHGNDSLLHIFEICAAELSKAIIRHITLKNGI